MAIAERDRGGSLNLCVVRVRGEVMVLQEGKTGVGVSKERVLSRDK